MIFISTILACALLLSPALSYGQEKSPSLQISENAKLYQDTALLHGIPVYQQALVDYRRGSKTMFKLQFTEPVVISVAARPEKWGFFQFPDIGRKQDGSLLAKWHMAADAIESYGGGHYGTALSKDNGKTWTLQADSSTLGGVELPNGDQLAVVTPKPIKVEDLQLPPTVGSGWDNYAKQPYIFYKLHDMPEVRQGVFQKRLTNGQLSWKPEQARLVDPQGLRYSFRGLVPVVWWGDMRVAKDGSAIAGIYPGFYLAPNGVADKRSGIFFYRSVDNGRSWNIQGRILYAGDSQKDPEANERMGFMEPAFEILSNGNFLCVSRTTDGAGPGPMYANYSSDLGQTWSEPVAFTPAGVKPRLLQLKNGVIVLASGRPGVQLRLSKNGRNWTDPFEMLPWKLGEKNDDISCGYTELLATGPDRFLIIFSDFKYPNAAGETRKAIKVREIIVSGN